MPRKSKKLKDDDSTQNRLAEPIASTSTTLLLRIREGDPIAWNRFVEIYSPLIRHWCKKPGGKLTRTDRQDITQEVLAKVGKSIGRFEETREGRSFRAWLRTITQCTIVDHLEEIKKRKDISRLMSDTGPHKPNGKEPYNKPFELTEEPDERVILLQQILRTVQPLFNEEHWEVIQLLVIAENSSSEVAEIMNMKGNTVRKIKSRILKRIREEYAKLGIDDEIPSL